MAKKEIKKNVNKKVEAKETKKKSEYTPPSEIKLGLMPYLLVLIAFFFLLCILYKENSRCRRSIRFYALHRESHQ